MGLTLGKSKGILNLRWRNFSRFCAISTCWSFALLSAKKSSMALNLPVKWHLGQMKLPTRNQSISTRRDRVNSYPTRGFVDEYLRWSTRHGTRTCRLDASWSLGESIFRWFYDPFTVVQGPHGSCTRKGLAVSGTGNNKCRPVFIVKCRHHACSCQYKQNQNPPTSSNLLALRINILS